MGAEEESLREALVAEVTRIKDEYVYPDLGRAFQHWAAVNVLGVEDNKVADELGGAMGSDGGIDYFHVDGDNKMVEIMQAKFSERREAQVDHKAILEFCDIPRKLLTYNAEQNPRLHEQQRSFKESRDRKYTTRLLFVTTASMPKTTREIVGLKDQNMDSDMTLECLEIKDLIAYVGNPMTPPCELRLSKNECYVGKSDKSKIKRMVATVTAPELKKIYKSIGSPTLFSLNPRFYLGARTEASKGIKKTLSEEPEKLWHYNNGISAVCKRFDYCEETGTLNVYNLKVVNGCQTVTTIGKAKNLDPDAGVVFRLSETDDAKFSEKISMYTNSQNRIRNPDLLANHPYLINLEKRFAVHEKFFFERKRGQLASSNKRIQSKQALYVIKSVDAARLKMAYSLGMPNLSMQLSDTKLFTDEPIDSTGWWPFEKLFKDADPLDFIAPHVFFYLLNQIKKRTGDSTADEKNVKFLLRYRIGQYYILGMIGKIISAMSKERKGELVSAIVNSAIKYDDVMIDNVVSELTILVEWIAQVIPEVMDNDDDGKPLYMQRVYYLRDPLRQNNKLDCLYCKRQGYCKLVGRRDPFETKLCRIFGII